MSNSCKQGEVKGGVERNKKAAKGRLELGEDQMSRLDVQIRLVWYAKPSPDKSGS